MQLYSVEQKRSQALEAHAAAFSTIKAAGRSAPSTVISFAQKTYANGTLTSKLHVIELGAPAGDSGRLCCSGRQSRGCTQRQPSGFAAASETHQAVCMRKLGNAPRQRGAGAVI